MKRLLLLIPLALIVAGCSTTPKPQLITKEYKVVSPPADFYNCPSVSKFPNPDTLTDEQVGALLVKLQSNNVKCKKNMAAIKAYIEKAKKTIEGRSVSQ